jgi:hypothetical protein
LATAGEAGVRGPLQARSVEQLWRLQPLQSVAGKARGALV